MLLYPEDFPSFKRGIVAGFQEWLLYFWMLFLGVLAMMSIVIVMGVLFFCTIGEKPIQEWDCRHGGE